MKNFAFSLKAVAVAMGMMGIAQCASAAVLNNTPSTGNGSFMFFAVDDTNKSWLQGINFTLNDSYLTTEQTFNLGNVSEFFTGAVNGRWGVIAGDSGTSQGEYTEYRMAYSMATDTTADSIRQGGTGYNQFAVRNSAETFQTWLNRIDDGNRVTNAPLISTTASDPYNIYGSGIGLDMYAQGQFYAGNLVNGAELTNWIFDNGFDVLEVYEDSTFAAQSNWRLNLDTNQLVYAPAAAPVPVPAALWLLGSALIGVAGIRRRA
jgi:hypothetical protein